MDISCEALIENSAVWMGPLQIDDQQLFEHEALKL